MPPCTVKNNHILWHPAFLISGKPGVTLVKTVCQSQDEWRTWRKMGIAVKELLSLEYFKDFYVIAGKKGLDREIQGITIMDAPDGFRWTVGKELVLSSGYAIAQDPDCIRRAFEDGSYKKTAAMMIKRGRYLPKIPEELIELHDKYNVPLISMPFSAPWMEVMSQINMAVLNRTIRRFRLQHFDALQSTDQTYKVQKIRRILQAVEIEMNFPAFLYDLNEQQGYYSSANFRKITESFGLNISDYWEPSRPHTVHTLCDNLQMKRIRLTEQGNLDGPLVSWIRIPIVMNGVILAYFIVMESRELLDYYDEFSIRVAFLMLQGVYEQIMVAQSIGNIGFENLILYALNSGENDRDKLIAQASAQGIHMSTEYVCAVFRQTNRDTRARNMRSAFTEVFRAENTSGTGRLAFLEENEGVVLWEAHDPLFRGKDSLETLLSRFSEKIQRRFPDMHLEFGLFRSGRPLSEIRLSIEKCRKALSLGKRLLETGNFWDYESLGALAWLQVPEDELKDQLKIYRDLMQDEKNIEILKTLKVYLANNMNYSVTAEKLYVHINTVRKRIDRVNDLLPIDWDSRISRLNAELLLQFLEL